MPQAKELQYLVCEEAPVELIVNGVTLVTFMCTPQDLKDLAMGHLVARGVVSNMDEVYTMAACEDMKKIYVRTGTELEKSQYGLGSVLASSCGSGSHFREEFLAQTPNTSDFSMSMAKLKEHAVTMFREAVMHRDTGGMHCAALADGQEVLAVREDVGRHNALDKVIGKGVFLSADFGRCALLSTGRVATDMALKAVAMGTPIVATRSIPTSMALEIAEKLGITMVGRIASSQPVVYCHGERILLEEEQAS